MKYKCEMVRDLIPLCLDNAASQASKETVIEHLSECPECKGYYDRSLKEPAADQELQEANHNYLKIAKKLRRRKTITRISVILVIFVMFEFMVNYAQGYRFTPESASSLAGRLNASSYLLGSYDWGNWEFYFYNSANSYDVVTVKKNWNGWKAEENWLVWPKYNSDNGGIINAGSLYYWTDTDQKFGIQLFPVLVQDPEVASLEVTIFGQTKSHEVTTDQFGILTFENSNVNMGNESSGFAYDANGNVLYQLITSDETNRWVWARVTE